MLLKQKSSLLFWAIALFLVLQLAWWNRVFLQNVSFIEELKTRVAHLERQPVSHTREIQSEASRRRLMFASESAFFGLVMILGWFLLYRALRAEERSRTTQKSFIEIVTHESKTPLTALKLRLESLLERNLEPLTRKEVVSGLDEVRRLSSTFEKAMNLNRLERHAYTFEDLSPTELVKQVLRRLDPLVKKQNVEITFDCETNAQVKGDAFTLMNAIQSLVENAILYNDNVKKKIEISVKKDSSTVILGVNDNGPGIPELDQNKIFEKFYRGQTGGKVPGTGLGLYLAQVILQAHRGDLRLVTGNEQGSVFEMVLPVVPA